MPVLPLFDVPPHPDAWHHVTAPGGYEIWRLDAEDAAGGLRLIATLGQGGDDPEYLRRYRRYLRRPTRHAPPQPAEYPCASLAVYEGEKVLAKFAARAGPQDFSAATDRPEVRVGPHGFRRDDDGTTRVSFAAPQLAAEWVLRPRNGTTGCGGVGESTYVLRVVSGAEHRWVLPGVLHEVAGEIRIDPAAGGAGAGGRVIRFQGRGYYDHTFGTAPAGRGLRCRLRGRVLLEDRTLAFHVAEPRPGAGGRGAPVRRRRRGRARNRGRLRRPGAARLALPGYPSEIAFGGALRLSSPRVVDRSPLRTLLAYEADAGGETGVALCEVIHSRKSTGF